MDNTMQHDNLNLGKVFSGAKNIWYAVKKPVPKKTDPVEAERAAAQKISDAGGYLTLTPEQKALIPVPGYINTQAANGANITDLQAAPPIPATSGQIIQKIKNYLPWILGAVGLGLVVYFTSKKR